MNDQGLVDAVMVDYTRAELTPRQRAICNYAIKLTKRPAETGPTDLDLLREQGLDDADLLDVVQVISYFNYINRVADALGVPDEDDWLPR